MELTQTQLQSYVDGARRRERERTTLREQRREQARELAKRAAAILKTDFGAEEVLLYGSAVHGAWFREDSDIDLAVSGIPASAFWHAWAAISALTADIEVNLIDLADATAALLQEIRMTGEAL